MADIALRSPQFKYIEIPATGVLSTVCTIKINQATTPIYTLTKNVEPSTTAYFDISELEKDIENNIDITSDKLKQEDVMKYDFIISFGYRHIVKQEIIDLFQDNNIINLHISIFAFIIGSVNEQLNSETFLFSY